MDPRHGKWRARSANFAIPAARRPIGSWAKSIVAEAHPGESKGLSSSVAGRGHFRWLGNFFIFLLVNDKKQNYTGTPRGPGDAFLEIR
jgi:hypothetical protein